MTEIVRFSVSVEDDLLNKHLKAPVPVIAAYNDEVTSAFSELVSNMMAKKPDKRPESMDEILDDIQKIRCWKSEYGTEN